MQSGRLLTAMHGRLFDALLDIASRNEDSMAWIELEPKVCRHSWRDVRSRTLAAATWLTELGIAPGDLIVNVSRSSLAWAVLDLACSALNAVHVAIDMRFSTETILDCIQRIEPKIVFAEPSLKLGSNLLPIDRVLNHGRSVPSTDVARSYKCDDLATILFTSGTSGASKGVMLSHRNLVSNAAAKLDAMPQSVSDVRLNFLPFAHAYARTCELSAWVLSGSAMATASGIDDWFRSAPMVQPTLVNGVPLFFERCAEHVGNAAELRSLLGGRMRRVASGGAAASDAVRSLFADFGLPIFQGYGLTEASPVVCSNRDASDGRGPQMTGVGPVVQGTEVRIDDDGKLWVRGQGVMLGYWRDSAATSQRMHDGWLDTGDIARWDADDSGLRPCVQILGRADDTIVLSSGYKIHPHPIEQALIDTKVVEDCMVVGKRRPFPILIARLSQLPDDLGTSTMRDWESGLLPKVLENLPSVADYERPRHVLIATEPWDNVHGLRNFKGAKRRQSIESFYSERIENVYHAANARLRS